MHTATLGNDSTLYQLLGLRGGGHSPLDIAKAVEKGIPVQSAQKIADVLFPEGGRNAVEQLVSRATLARLKKGQAKRFSKETSENLYSLIKVVSAAVDLYHGDTEKAQRFLTRPHPLLGGESPFEMARKSNAGADVVMNLLRQIRAGVYV